MTLQPNWISGFVDGEGTFYVGINANKTMSIGYQVLPEFRVVQHEKDIQVLHAIKSYFKCGVVRVNHGDRMEYRVRKIEHLLTIIIPFFEKYPLVTKKRTDFSKFKRIVLHMEQDKHLEKDGLNNILRIAHTMNRNNKFKTITKITTR